MLLIGDVHGKWNSYIDKVKDHEASIQLGDFGIGFAREDTVRKAKLDKFFSENTGHRFIRGNHDNPEVCKHHPNYIKNGTFENGIMFIGGAYSIDKNWRVPGEDWWEDEEDSYQELMELIVQYENNKPSIMITHDAPDIIARQMFNFYTDSNESRTRAAFETMFEIHKPDAWFFGHWHMTKHLNVLGTEFMCLNELDTYELDLKPISAPKI